MRYLGRLFEQRHAEGHGETLEAIGESAGIAKQQVITLRDGGTVGLDILTRIADRLTGGSVDRLFADARAWYENLSERERRDIAAWARISQHRRTKPKRLRRGGGA
jgi:hypothetical protein